MKKTKQEPNQAKGVKSEEIVIFLKVLKERN